MRMGFEAELGGFPPQPSFNHLGKASRGEKCAAF
jgi:hypothetical protein